MTFVYLICFLLLAVGAVLLLKLTPERITGDLMRFVSPKQTLRDKVLTRKGKKKSRKITVELRRIKDALEQTGKGNQFAVACAASLLLMIVGCVIAIMIDNPFLVPVFAIAFAMIPFIYAKRTVAYYDNHVKEELETALSIITTSYVRTDDTLMRLVYEKYASKQKKDEDEIPPSSISVEQVLSEQNNPPSDRPHDIPEGAKLHNVPRPEELP